ncbi:hypothetical protein ABDK00_012195 [Niabella insulamsoli]|uniref:hypothetical protein n=1 Tax=Niabella insulamsoli TaxID=3144874 RepID=UPI0031FBAAE9
MKAIFYALFLFLFSILISCGKTDIIADDQHPQKLEIEQLVSLMGQPFDSISAIMGTESITVTDSLGVKKAMLPLLDRESPNPNFMCELIEADGRVGSIHLRSTASNHGTSKNTFFYFDRVLSEKFPLIKFYAVDADGGINDFSQTKEELYNYLNYNSSSGAALEFNAPAATILSFCFYEAEKDFVISIEKK